MIRRVGQQVLGRAATPEEQQLIAASILAMDRAAQMTGINADPAAITEVTRPDPQAQAEVQLERMNPGEAGAYDMVQQVSSLAAALSGALSQQGIG